MLTAGPFWPQPGCAHGPVLRLSGRCSPVAEPVTESRFVPASGLNRFTLKLSTRLAMGDSLGASLFWLVTPSLNRLEGIYERNSLKEAVKRSSWGMDKKEDVWT